MVPSNVSRSRAGFFTQRAASTVHARKDTHLSVQLVLFLVRHCVVPAGAPKLTTRPAPKSDPHA